MADITSALGDLTSALGDIISALRNPVSTLRYIISALEDIMCGGISLFQWGCSITILISLLCTEHL